MRQRQPRDPRRTAASALDIGVSALDIGVSALDIGVSALDIGVSALDIGVSALDSSGRSSVGAKLGISAAIAFKTLVWWSVGEYRARVGGSASRAYESNPPATAKERTFVGFSS